MLRSLVVFFVRSLPVCPLAALKTLIGIGLTAQDPGGRSILANNLSIALGKAPELLSLRHLRLDGHDQC